MDGFSSIQSKALNKIDSLTKLGIDVQGVFVKKGLKKEQELNNTSVIIPLKNVVGLFQKIRYKKQALLALDSYLKKYLKKEDLIYMRYPNADYYLWKFTRKYKDQIIFEFNTNHLQELKHHASAIPFGVKPSKFLTWFQERFYPVNSEKLWAKRSIKNAKFTVAMSSEIAKNTQQKVGEVTPCYAIANGINTVKIPESKPKIINGTINLLFMQGAQSSATYYGKDRLMNGFLDYANKDAFKITMLGSGFDNEIAFVKEHNLEKYFDFKGVCTGEELNKVFDNIHVGIGSLALHRVGINIGSVLKVAEYAARAIPMMIGYKDMNVSFNEKLIPFVLHYPATETPIDFNKLKKFANGIYLNPSHLNILRKEAVETMDFEVKMRKLKELINNHIQ